MSTIGLALLAIICGLGSVFMICFFAALCRETRTRVVFLHRSTSSPSQRQTELPFGTFQHPQPHRASVTQIDVVVVKRKDGFMQQPMGSAKLFELPLLSDRKISAHTYLRRIGTRWSGLLFLICIVTTSSLAQDSDESSSAEIQQLKSMVQQLQARVTQLEKQQGISGGANSVNATVASGGAVAADPAQPQAAQAPTLSAEDRGILDFFHDTTINVGVDTYYSYNFNAPIGRVNLLRAYDVLSNTFSLNQASLIFDHPPDAAAGRRVGARVDLQFGQATDTLQGNPSNEPRPQIYRNIFQAYGTYIIPLGRGVNVDFGKWASSLGIEGNYTKDQMNYSRSYWFNFLPFYHMGLRANYKINDRLGVNYWVVNGTNQTEPTNAFKDQMFGFVAQPNNKLAWTVNYYYGQEHPDVVQVANTGTAPIQPGLSFAPIRPAPNGRLHIVDSYVTWQATPKLTLALEGDYVIQRLWKNAAPGESAAPSHTDGGAAYVQYQFRPKMAVASRAEYLSDRGGLFSGKSEALKEVTLTYSYFIADGFLLRTEYRRDFSNQPIFITDTAGVLSDHQTTATLGLTWWWGRKEGAW